jgi:hypothetical protein
MLDDLQVLLRRLGLMSGRISKYNREYGNLAGACVAA